jgi:competence protein ComEC
LYNALVIVPLLWVSVAFLAGIVVAAHLQLPLLIWLALAAMALVLVALQPRFWPSGTSTFGGSPISFPSLQQGPSPVNRPLLIFFSLFTFFIGGARYQLTVPQHGIAQVDWFNDRKYDMLVTGTVVDPPDYRDTYTNLRLRVQSVQFGSKEFPAGGLLLARVPPNRTYEYGQIMRLRGRLQTPPTNEDFSYREYLARQDVYSYMPNAAATVLPGSTASPILTAVYNFKSKLLDNIYRLFVDPEASLLAGILLGVDSGLSQPLQQAFKDTGTAHIIAISGFNIAIIAGIFVYFFSRLFGPRRGALLAVIGVALYTLLVGADPSVVRAALMGTLSLFAVQVGRRQMGLNTLAFVAALMAAWNPYFLWDVGFQLSFFATLGLILYGEPFQSATEKFLARYFPPTRATRLAGFLGEVVLLTFAAQLTTLPIMAYHFQQISLVSFIANPFILPAQPAVMVLGGVAVAASLIVFPLGRLLAFVAWPLTAYTIRMVEFFDSLPHGLLYLGGSSLAFVIAFYAVLLGVTFGGTQLKDLYASLRQRFRFLTISVVITSLFICTLLVWRLEAARPDGQLHITFLNVGSADAVLIQTPGGRNVLIDGGPSTSTLSDALGRRISPLAPSLDWLIMASTDESQVASLPRILPRYPPRNALVAGNPGASFSSRTVMEWLDSQSVPVQQAELDQVLDLGDGALIRVVDVSSLGATLLVSWNKFHMLLPIGANLSTLDALQNGALIGPVDAISLAQNGYAPLTPPTWIANLNPQLVVVSVAPGDVNGRPDKETLDALAGRSILRTDVNGWIDVSTDGQQMWVNVERPTPGTPEPKPNGSGAVGA